MNEYDALVSPPKAEPTDDYAPAVQSTMDDQKSTLQSSMFVASKTDPDRAAAVQQLAVKTKLPTDVVDRNYDDVQQKHEVASTDYDAIISQTPKTGQWLGDPKNSSVAKDDIHNLQKTEDGVQEYSRLSSMYHGMGSVFSTISSDIFKLGGAAYDTAVLPYNLIAPSLGMAQAQSPEVLRSNMFSKYYDELAKAHSAASPDMSTDVWEELGKGNLKKAANAAVVQAFSSSPYTLGLLAATYAGFGLPALAVMGGLQAADVNTRSQAVPGISPASATGNALLQGTAEAAFEELGTVLPFKQMSAKIAAKYGFEVAAEVAKHIGHTLLYSTATEGAEEGATQAVQDFSDYVTGANPDAMKGTIGRIANATVVGGLSGLMFGGPSAIAAGVSRGHQTRQAALTKDFYVNTGEHVKESALRARAPEAFETHFNQVSQGTAAENIAIDPKAIDTYFQSQKLNPVEEMHKIGMLDEYTKAKESGADLVVPYSKWINNTVDTDHYNGLADDVKFLQPDNSQKVLSANEAKADHEETKAQIAQADKEAQADNHPLIQLSDERIQSPGFWDNSGSVSDVVKTKEQAEHLEEQLLDVNISANDRIREKGGSASTRDLLIANDTKSGLAAISKIKDSLPSSPPLEETSDSAKQVGGEIAQQLKQEGLDPRNAIIIEQHFNALASRLGTDALDEFNKYRLEVKANQDLENSSGLNQSGLNTQEYLEQEYKGLSQEEKVQRHFIDPTTGVLNQRAFDASTAPADKPNVASIGVQGVKFVNDTINHQAGDDLYKYIGQALQQVAPNRVFKTGGDFAIHVKDKAELNSILEAAQAALPEKMNLGGKTVDSKAFSLSGAVAATNKEAQSKHLEAKKKEEAAGTRPARDQKPTGFQQFENESGNPAASEQAKISDDLRQAHQKLSHVEAFNHVTIDPQTGMLTPEAFMRLPPKASRASIDLDGLRVLNDEFGHSVGDALIKIFAREAARTAKRMGVNVDFAHKSGDEFLAQHEDGKVLEQVLIEAERQLWDNTITFEDKNGQEQVLHGILFGTGIGPNDKIADSELQRSKNDRSSSRSREHVLARVRPSASQGEQVQRYIQERHSGVRSRLDARTSGRGTGQSGPGQGGQTFNQSRQDISPLGFYSKLARTIEEKMGNSATVEQVNGMLRDMKPEERKWSGIDDFLKGKEKVSKPELLEFLAANQLQIQEITKEDAQSFNDIGNGDTKFSQYTLPGGENYREVLFTLPVEQPEALPDKYDYFKDEEDRWLIKRISDGETFAWGNTKEEALTRFNKEYVRPANSTYDSSHWHEPNVLAHVRLNDRTDVDGKKVLFVEEIQSDWHQEGRKSGYLGDAKELPPGHIFEDRGEKEANPKNRWVIRDTDNRIAGFGATKEAALEDFHEVNNNAVPDAPLRKTWHEFALKRIIRMAAEGGYDKIAWTTGEQQAERYPRGGDEQAKEAQLKGMSGFYDKILVDFANKFGKKFGAKVVDSVIPGRDGISQYEVRSNGDNGYRVVDTSSAATLPARTVEYFDNKNDANSYAAELNDKNKATVAHSLDISEPLKEAALNEGFSLFQHGDTGPRGQIQFMDRGAIIKLSKSADPSTFFHESGHYFLEVLRRAALSENAPQQVKNDYKALLDWMGAKEGEELSVENHEQFARGFEAYLMEGNAPSSALKQAFTRFKIWLTSVYKQLSNLNVQLTPEVRNVMDRLLATDEEIAHAKQQQNLSPLFPDPSKFGLTGEKANRYQKAVDDAKEAAEETLTRKVMDEYRREKAAAWKEERNKLKESIAAEVNKQPVYIADSIMRRGVMPDGSPLPDGVTQVKMDFDQVPENLRRTVPRGTMTKDGTGFPPDIAAGVYGFASGTDLIHALSSAVPREQAINQMADAQMKEKHGDIMTDGTMPEEAMKAIHNEKQAELMRLELEHLASNEMLVLKDMIRQVARRVPTVKQVREHAQRTIGGQAVGEIKPFLYERAGAKMAKLAGELLAKGDFKGAYEAKLKELFNHELYRAAIAAQEDVDKSLTRFKKIIRGDNDTIAKTRDMDLVNAARAVLAEFGIGKSDQTAADFLAPMEHYDPDTYGTMKTMVDSATQRPGPYKTVAYNDFADMRNTVNALWDLARTTREIEVDGQKMDRGKAIAELGEGIAFRTKPGEKSGYTRSTSEWAMTKMYLMGARAAFRRIESWVDSIDAGQPNGPFRRILFNPIVEATAKYRTAKTEYIKKYSDLLGTIGHSLTNEEISSPELRHIFENKAQVLGAILHSGNQSNLQKLLRGYGWGSVDENGVLDTSKWDAFKERMYKEGVITKADMDFAQGIWNLMEELKPLTQAAHKAMYGFYYNEVTAEPVVTPFGTYRGGYVPARVDQFKATDAAARADKEALTGTQNSFAFPTSGRGATKSRVEAYAAPLQFDLGFLAQHIDWALRFGHIEPAVKSAAKILMNKEFRAQMDGLDPAIIGDALIPWLQRAAKQSIAGNTQGWWGKGADRFWTGVRSRVGMNIMVANVTNAMQQLTGLSIAAVRVPPRHLRDALVTFGKNPKSAINAVNEQSEFMRTRTTGQLFEIQQKIDDLLLNPTKFQQASKFVKQHGYILQSATQNVVDIVTWTGAYNHAIEQGQEGPAAVHAGDSAVRMTQGSFNPEDISRFETGTPFAQMFKMFSGYFNMQANLNATEFANAWRDMGLRKGAGMALYVYAMGFMIPSVLSELITKAMSGKLDDDDDGSYVNDFLRLFFGSQVKTLTAMTPAFGPVVNAAINRWNDKAYDDAITVSPAISALESLVSSPKSVYQAIVEGGSKKKATRDALTAIGLLSGLPVAPLSKPASYLLDYSDGTAQPSGPIDFARGLVTGKPGAQR